MTQRSRKAGNLSVTVSVKDWRKHRRMLSLKRREMELPALSTERIDHELKAIAHFVQNKGGCQLDAKVTLETLAELKQCYVELLGTEYPEVLTQQRTVNLELAILQKLVLEAPMSLVEGMMTRLEDLHCSCASEGFLRDDGSPNPRLDAIGRLLTRQRLSIPWHKFPLLETFMIREALMERSADQSMKEFQRHPFARKIFKG
jgi:hypothetical protein